MNTPEYDNLRKRLAAMLERDALLHTLGQYAKIGGNFLEIQALLTSGGDQRYRKLIVALNFWDTWILARNTDWLEREHITEDDWPELAIGIVNDLLADRDITDPRIRAAFDLTATLELPKQYGPKRQACPLDAI